MDEIVRQDLLSRFAAYLDGLDEEETAEALAGTAPEGRQEADLFSVFVELTGLRNEVRTESRLVKEALDRFRSAFDTLQSSHAVLEQELKKARSEAREREGALVKPLLLGIIAVRDRLADGLKQAGAAPPRWYERFLPNRAAHTAQAEAWREGLRMTVRRVDGFLAEQHVATIETVGRPLDPRHAAAVARVEDPCAADGTVVEELRAGFLWQGELLRPAEVIVSRRAPGKGACP